MGMLSRNRTQANPWPSPWDMQDEFGRMWDEFNRHLGWTSATTFTPPLDIRETPDAYAIELDVPGLTKDDLDIEMADNVLTITGERKSEREDTKDGYHRAERQFGAFRRVVSIPGGFKSDQVEATVEDGVLRVILPKPEERKPRRIEVTSN